MHILRSVAHKILVKIQFKRIYEGRRIWYNSTIFSGHAHFCQDNLLFISTWNKELLSWIEPFNLMEYQLCLELKSSESNILAVWLVNQARILAIILITLNV